MQILLHKLREKELPRTGNACDPQNVEKKAEKYESTAVSGHLSGWQDATIFAPAPRRDTLELSFLSELIPECGCNYAAMAKAMRSAGTESGSRLFRDSFSVMKDYYEGRMEEEGLVSGFRDYCKRLSGNGEQDGFFGEKAFHAIAAGYEYYSRASARNAVRQNQEEGRRLVEECGLNPPGMLYYNADYYYLCRKVNNLLKSVCSELAEEFGIACPDFEEMERNTRFYREGGITYHGIWEWSGRTGFDSCPETGLRNGGMKPPEQFIFLYCSSFDRKDVKKAELLVQKIDGLLPPQELPKDRWKLFTLAEDASYHNGLSYLLDEASVCRNSKNTREKAMSFLANFKLYRNSGCLELLHTAEE